MKDKRRIKKDEKLPLIIPIVVYTGKGKWNVVNDIKDCQEQLEGYTNMGLGSYILIDSNDYTKQELLNDELFIFKMMALEKAKDSDELYNNLKEIAKEEKEQSNTNFLSQVIKHIYIEALGEERAKNIINEINKVKEEGDGKMMIEVFKKDREQQWQKGRQEGEKIGEKIGIAKAIVQMVKEMIKSNITDEQIMKIAKIDEKELQRLKEA